MYVCCVSDLGRYVWVCCVHVCKFMIWRVTSEKIKQKCSIPTRDLGKITCKTSVTQVKVHVMLFSHHKVDNGPGHVQHTADILFYLLLDVIIFQHRPYHLALFEQRDLSYKQKMGVTLHSRVFIDQMNLVHRSK